MTPCAFLFVEAIPSSGSLLVKTFPVMKTMPVVEAILFSESHFSGSRSFLLEPLSVVKANSCSEIHFF